MKAVSWICENSLLISPLKNTSERGKKLFLMIEKKKGYLIKRMLNGRCVQTIPEQLDSTLFGPFCLVGEDSGKVFDNTQ